MPVKAQSAAQLLEKFTRKGGPDDCWQWTGKLDRRGYGRVIVWRKGNRQDWIAHRLSWANTFGHPGKDWVLHRCDNPGCVNPSHLFLGNAQTNVDDMYAKGRNVHLVGSQIPVSKLKEADIPEIFRMRHEGMLLADIAAKFNVRAQTIDSALKRRTWRHVEVSL